MARLQWQDVREQVCHLYRQGKPLDEVKAILARENGFHACTRSYRKRLEKWGCRRKDTARKTKPRPVSDRHHWTDHERSSDSSNNAHASQLPSLNDNFGASVAADSLLDYFQSFGDPEFDWTTPSVHQFPHDLSLSTGALTAAETLDHEGMAALAIPHSTHLHKSRTERIQHYDHALASIRQDIDRGQFRSLTKEFPLLDGKDTILHHLACKPKYHDVFSQLLRQMQSSHMSVDIKSSYGSTALHMAIISHCNRKVHQLLRSGASTSCQDACGQCPIHVAIQCENQDACKALLAAGATLDDATREIMRPMAEIMLNESIDKVAKLVSPESHPPMRFGCALCKRARQYYLNHTGESEYARMLVQVTRDEDLAALCHEILHPCHARSQVANLSTARGDMMDQILRRWPSGPLVDIREIICCILCPHTHGLKTNVSAPDNSIIVTHSDDKLSLPPSHDTTNLLKLVCRYHDDLKGGQRCTSELLGSDPRILRSLASMEPPHCYDAATILFGDPAMLRRWLAGLIMSQPTIGMLAQPCDPAIPPSSSGFYKQFNQQTLNPQDFGFDLHDQPACSSFGHDSKSSLVDYWLSHHWHEYPRPAALQRLTFHLRSGLDKPSFAALGGAMTDKDKRTTYRVMQCIVHAVSTQAMEFAKTELVNDIVMCKQLTIDAFKARQRFGLPDFTLSSQHFLLLCQAEPASCIPFENLFAKF